MIEVDENKLIPCPVCSAVNIDKGKENSCRRCGSAIYHHRHFSTEKSWAFLLTAIIAYIPANLYPMLVTNQFGSQEGSTILRRCDTTLGAWFLPYIIDYIFCFDYDTRNEIFNLALSVN